MSIWTESLSNLDNVDLEDETDNSEELDETDEEDTEDEEDTDYHNETKTVEVTVTGTYQVYGSDYDTREEWDNLLHTEQKSYDDGDLDISDVAYTLENQTVTVNSVSSDNE
jgi:hypothetical protein